MRHTTYLLLICSLLAWAACEDEPVEPDYIEPGTEEPIDTMDQTSPIDSTLFLVPVLPEELANYSQPDLPDHFNATFLNFTNNTPASNPVTDAGATLGRVLFYDKKLSANNSLACASCHIQENGFSDPRPFSIGFEGEVMSRNSMPVVNMRHGFNFFWDARVNSLEEQVLIPLQSHIEMGMDLDTLVAKLDTIDYYAPLFEEAFGSDEISTTNISRALSQFLRSIISYQSKYDAGVENDFADFTEQELLGKSLFFTPETNCNACHMTALFTDVFITHNGLDEEYADQGVGALTNPSNNGKFKTPSVRNVALTAPYMHDGRFETLAEVVEHYNSGIQPHPNLDDRLTVEGDVGGTPRQLNLTEEEKAALVAFLETLTDEVLMSDEKFSDPFE